jgi:hypothetical protein
MREGMGGKPKVKGMSRAMARVAVRPGMDPKRMPMNIPPAIMRILMG